MPSDAGLSLSICSIQNTARRDYFGVAVAALIPWALVSYMLASSGLVSSWLAIPLGLVPFVPFLVLGLWFAARAPLRISFTETGFRLEFPGRIVNIPRAAGETIDFRSRTVIRLRDGGKVKATIEDLLGWTLLKFVERRHPAEMRMVLRGMGVSEQATERFLSLGQEEAPPGDAVPFRWKEHLLFLTGTMLMAVIALGALGLLSLRIDGFLAGLIVAIALLSGIVWLKRRLKV